MAPAFVDKEGVWGKRTSTLDWCEENYVVTPYIAEFWNTISNIVMIIPPAVCAYYFWKKGVELRHILSGISLLVVGIGSWCFHMTLLYEMQLLDELPMIYGSCVFLYALNHHAHKPNHRSYTYIFALIFICIFVTVVYLYWKNPMFHESSYAILVFYLLYEAVKACKNHREIIPLAGISLVTYASGFVLWNIDNNFCSSLRHTRNHQLHPSVGPVTQLHAWWHLLTGAGTYLHILFSAYARSLHLKRECSIKMLGGVWPYLHLGEKV